MRLSHLLLATAALSGPLLVADNASAKTVAEACGAFDFSGNASCELKTSGGCDVACTPVNFQVQCAADLYETCSGMCNASANVDCMGTCQAQCKTDCMANAQFDCEGSCNTQCNSSCSGKCTTAMNQSECNASCNSTCSGECSANCSGTASADCNGKCSGCCTGSCKASANFDCQISCQGGAYAKCEANMQGGCKAQCTSPQGAIFCNGQYVNTSSIDDCAAALAAELNIKVTGYASCSGNTCKAGGSVSCAAAPVDASGDRGGFGYGMVAVMATGVGLSLARRRAAKKA